MRVVHGMAMAVLAMQTKLARRLVDTIPNVGLSRDKNVSGERSTKWTGH